MLTSAEHLLHINIPLLELLLLLLRWDLLREAKEDVDVDDVVRSLSPRFEEDDGRGEIGDDVTEDGEPSGEA